MVTVEVTNGCRYWSGGLDETINQSTDDCTCNTPHPRRDRHRQTFGNAGTNTGTGHGRQTALIRGLLVNDTADVFGMAIRTCNIHKIYL